MEVKKVAIVILVVVAVIVLAASAVLGTAGLFSKVSPILESGETITFVYEPFVGPYSKTKEPMDRIYYGLLNGEKVETFKGIGIYFDNPANTPAEKCRSVVGDILEPKDLARVDALKAKGFRIAELPAGERIVAEFPFTSPLSIMLGIMKVYPALGAALKSTKAEQGAVAEIYDVPAKKIRYLSLTPIETETLLKLMQ